MAKHPRFVSPAVLGVLVWSVFSTLGVYVLGSVLEAVLTVFGLTETTDQVDAASIGYVLLFLLAAAGHGVLAISYSRRHTLRKGFAALGVLGAPVVLGLVLLVVPTLLTAFGLLPTA